MSSLLFERFAQLGIAHHTVDHPPVFTAEEGIRLATHVPKPWMKNLFLKDNKKKLYLLSAVHDTSIRLRDLAKELNAPNLRFAQPELLLEHLGVTPGSVTPFGLIHDKNAHVHVLLDATIFAYEEIGFHPLRNDQTTFISPKNLEHFIAACGNTYTTIDFSMTDKEK